MIETLSHMYRETFGAWGLAIFLIGGFIVLFSTVFGATASNSRLFADAFSVFGLKHYSSNQDRRRMVRVGCIVLLSAALLVSIISGGAPVSLVLVGALAQGVMLPFLGLAAVYFRFRQTDRQLTPGILWTLFLLLAALGMIAVGGYQVWTKLAPYLGGS